MVCLNSLTDAIYYYIYIRKLYQYIDCCLLFPSSPLPLPYIFNKCQSLFLVSVVWSKISEHQSLLSTIMLVVNVSHLHLSQIQKISSQNQNTDQLPITVGISTYYWLTTTNQLLNIQHLLCHTIILAIPSRLDALHYHGIATMIQECDIFSRRCGWVDKKEGTSTDCIISVL